MSLDYANALSVTSDVYPIEMTDMVIIYEVTFWFLICYSMMVVPFFTVYAQDRVKPSLK